jgi:hypothetical protein
MNARRPMLRTVLAFGRQPTLGRTEAAVSPVWAAVAMLVQSVLAVFLVQAAARNRALLAGLLDCLMWPAGMVRPRSP